jgi:hypothetical protein
MKQGRRPGYKHSAETIEKIRQSRLGTKQAISTKDKIGKSMAGQAKSLAHRDRISESMLDVEGKCIKRFLALKAEYPGQEAFFEENRGDLLFAMRDIKSEKELADIRRYIESETIHDSTSYNYSSSSYHAAEDTMIALVDAVIFLRKFH